MDIIDIIIIVIIVVFVIIFIIASLYYWNLMERHRRTNRTDNSNETKSDKTPLSTNRINKESDAINKNSKEIPKSDSIPNSSVSDNDFDKLKVPELGVNQNGKTWSTITLKGSRENGLSQTASPSNALKESFGEFTPHNFRSPEDSDKKKVSNDLQSDKPKDKGEVTADDKPKGETLEDRPQSLVDSHTVSDNITIEIPDTKTEEL